MEEGKEDEVEPSMVLQLVKAGASLAKQRETAGVVFLSCAVFVVGGKRLGRLVGTEVVMDRFMPWVGVACVVSGAVFVVSLVRPTRAWCEEVRRWRRTRDRLHQLAENEKAILRRYKERRARAQNLDAHNVVMIGLVDAEILEKCSGDFFLARWPFLMPDRVWDYLDDNPELLDRDPPGRVTEDPPSV